jgi:hypothetical protein
VGHFTDEDELYRLIGETVRELALDERLVERFREIDGVLQLHYRDPDALITIDLRRGSDASVEFGDSDLEPDVWLDADADLAHRFWLGEVNLTIALARGHMRARGPVRKLLKLLPLLRPRFAGYRERLLNAGRLDLLPA